MSFYYSTPFEDLFLLFYINKAHYFLYLSTETSTSTEASKNSEADTNADQVKSKVLQAVDSDGNPICLFCENPVRNGFKAGDSLARFCSSNCKEEYSVSLFISFYFLMNELGNIHLAQGWPSG